MKISAEFVISAAGPRDFPSDGLAEIAMVGRSNVGKSSLINALVRQKIARTSAEPGKTRLVNVYRVARGASRPILLVDLPGYGYARRSKDGTGLDFDALADAYFGRNGLNSRGVSALLIVDTRHPGLDADRAAWQWLRRTTAEAALVGTKIDKLARGERIRALNQLESAFEDTVLPVSSVTGEGLDQLWKLIDRLTNSRSPQLPPLEPRRSLPNNPSAPTARPGARAPRRQVRSETGVKSRRR